MNALVEHKVMVFWDVGGNIVEDNYKSRNKVPKPYICISNTFHLLRSQLRINVKSYP